MAVKVVDIFGNDTMTIVEVNVGGKEVMALHPDFPRFTPRDS